VCECVYKLYMKQHPILCHVAVVPPRIMSESLRQPEAILRMAPSESDDLVILDTHIWQSWWFHKLVLVLSSEDSMLLRYLFLSPDESQHPTLYSLNFFFFCLLVCWMRILKVPASILATAVGKKWPFPHNQDIQFFWNQNP
jgi:hypothetical protein